MSDSSSHRLVQGFPSKLDGQVTLMLYIWLFLQYTSVCWEALRPLRSQIYIVATRVVQQQVIPHICSSLWRQRTELCHMTSHRWCFQLHPAMSIMGTSYILQSHISPSVALMQCSKNIKFEIRWSCNMQLYKCNSVVWSVIHMLLCLLWLL